MSPADPLATMLVFLLGIVSSMMISVTVIAIPVARHLWREPRLVTRLVNALICRLTWGRIGLDGALAHEFELTKKD